MSDRKKTRDQLIAEIEQLRQQVARLKTSEQTQLQQMQALRKEREELLVAEREQRLLAESLAQITSTLTSQTSRDTILNEVLRQVKRVVPHDTSNIMLLDGDVLRSAGWQGYETFGIDDMMVDLAQVLADYLLDAAAIRSRQPLIIPDTHQEPRWVTLKETAWIRSHMAVPLCLHDRVVGMLRLDAETPAKFSSADAERLQPLANAAAVALENVSLYTQAQQLNRTLEQRNRELIALHEIGRTLNSTLDLRQIYLAMYREVAQRLLNAPYLIIMLFDQVLKIISYGFAIINGQEIRPDRFLTFILGDDPISQTICTREPHHFSFQENDLPAELRGCLNEVDQAAWPRSALYMPLISGDKVVGVMNVQHYQTGAFREADMTLLSILASQAAVALENAQLFDKVQRYTAELEERVAEWRRVEAALGESEQRFRLVISSISDHIYVTEVTQDDRHINLYLSPHIEAMTGYPFANFISDWRFWPTKVIHPDDRAAAAAQAEQLARGFNSEVEYRLVRADGRVIWVRDSARVNQEGTSRIVYGVVSDITERKRVELERAWLTNELSVVNQTLDERVRARTAELQAILDAVGEGIVVTDRNGVIQYLNPALERLTGYSEEDTLGQTPSLWRSDQQDHLFYTQMWQTILSGQIWHGELVNRRRDGTLYNVLLSITPILGPDGEPLGFVGAQHDITPFKEMDRLKNEFISTAAHELRTPLTSIQGFSEILLTRDLNEERQKRYLTFINQQAETLAAITDDLLNLSRLESGQGFKPAEQPVDMKGIVSEVIFGFQENNPEHHYRVAGPEMWPQIKGDPTKLSQLFKNLFSNATKYSPNGGDIVLEAEYQEAYDLLHLALADEGIGMTQEQLAHMFERFYRADASNTAIGGTGLGMAISQLIVEQHGGKIWVESEYGVGTTVHMFFPLPDRSSYILIIEDDEGLRRLQQISLEFDGFIVLTAEKGQVGLQLAKTCLPNLILLDLNLPGMFLVR